MSHISLTAVVVVWCSGSAAQITITEHTLGGFWDIEAASDFPGSRVDDEVDIVGNGPLNFTRETSVVDPINGITSMFRQSYSTVVTDSAITLTGELTTTEFPTAFPGSPFPTPPTSTQFHLIGGSFSMQFPKDVPIRITGTLRHDPEFFPDNGPIPLNNGTGINLGLNGGGPGSALLAGRPSFPIEASTDGVYNSGSGFGFVGFQTDHLGGGGSPLGPTSVSWEVTFQIVPAPATFAAAPVGLLALRRRR